MKSWAQLLVTLHSEHLVTANPSHSAFEEEIGARIWASMLPSSPTVLKWDDIPDAGSGRELPDFAQKWDECRNTLKSLSSKRMLGRWHAQRTEQLEEWGQRVQLHNATYVRNVELQLHARDPDVHSLLDEVFEVLSRHLKVLRECPSEAVSVTPSVSDLWDSSDMGEQVPRPQKRKQRLNRAMLAKHASMTSLDEERLWAHNDALRGGRPDPSPAGGSTKSEDRFLLAPSSHAYKHWSRETGFSSSRVWQTEDVDWRVTSINESKEMVDAFIKQLFDLADTMAELANSSPPPDIQQERLSTGTVTYEESQYQDFAYRQAHNTVMKMAPYAEKCVWRRISRAASMRLRRLAESKLELGTALYNSTYYPGKYTHANPAMLEVVLRRVSSLPLSLTSTRGDEPGWKHRGLHRHPTFPPRTRSRGIDESLLREIGSRFPPEPRTSFGKVDKTSMFPTFDSKLLSSNETPGKTNEQPSSGDITEHDDYFVCFVESCATPYKSYNYRDWATHIQSVHPEAVSVRKPTAVWICRAWCHASQPGGYPSFGDEALFHKHMYDEHPETFNGNRNFLRTITKACFQQQQPPESEAQPTCPLCTLDHDEILEKARSNEVSEEDGEEDGGDSTDVARWGSVFLRHIADHYERINKRIMSSVPILERSRNSLSQWRPLFPEPSVKSLASDLESNVWLRDNVGGFARPSMTVELNEDLEDLDRIGSPRSLHGLSLAWSIPRVEEGG